MSTLAARLIEQARRTPDLTAIQGRDGPVSYGLLASRVCALADELRDAGVKPRTHVALMFPNSAEFAVSFFAAAAAGAIAMPLNPASTTTEISALLVDASTAAVLVSPSLAERAKAAVALAATPSRMVVVDSVSGMTAPSSRAIVPTNVSPNDPALCLYSSGSTGQPKRIERTHADLMWETSTLAAAVGISP